MFKFQSKPKFFTLLFIFAISLFGCTQKKLSPSDTLVVALDSEPENLDPRMALDATSQRLDQLIFDGLVIIDQNLKIVPHLAKEWKIIRDVTYQFTLRDDVTFHDGTQVTAEDVALSLQKILDPTFASPLSGAFQNVESVKVLNPHTLEIKLKQPQANFLTDLTLIKAIPHNKADTVKEHLIGTGPYQFVKKETNTIILKRNPNHFKYKPQLETLMFKVIKDDSTRSLKLKKGELDLVQNALSADSIEKLEKDPTLTFTKSPGLSPSYLGLNMKDPVLKNKKVRQAMAYAINRDEIITHLLQGLASPANSMLSPLNWYHEPNTKSYPYDPELSKKLLKESGVPLPIHLVYKTSTDVQAVNIARLISDQLKQVGIDIELRTFEWGTFFNDIKQGNFQIFSLKFAGVTDPDLYFDILHSSNFPPGKNRVFYSNSNVDKFLEQGRISTNPDRRKKIYSEIQKIAAEDLPYIPLWHLSNVAIYSPRIKGFFFHPQANFMPFVELGKE